MVPPKDGQDFGVDFYLDTKRTLKPWGSSLFILSMERQAHICETTLPPPPPPQPFSPNPQHPPVVHGPPPQPHNPTTPQPHNPRQHPQPPQPPRPPPSQPSAAQAPRSSPRPNPPARSRSRGRSRVSKQPSLELANLPSDPRRVVRLRLLSSKASASFVFFLVVLKELLFFYLFSFLF